MVHGSAPIPPLHRGRALHIMTMVVAALDLLVAGAEESNTMCPAETALAPARMDHPCSTSAATNRTAGAASPSTAAGMNGATTLYEAAPRSSAATHLCELVAECADAMS